MSERLTDKQLDALMIEARLMNGDKTDVGRWIARHEGVAVYRYHGDGQHVRLKFVNYGSGRASIKLPYPPVQMPRYLSIPGWDGYTLVGYYRKYHK